MKLKSDKNLFLFAVPKWFVLVCREFQNIFFSFSMSFLTDIYIFYLLTDHKHIKNQFKFVKVSNVQLVARNLKILYVAFSVHLNVLQVAIALVV